MSAQKWVERTRESQFGNKLGECEAYYRHEMKQQERMYNNSL